MLDKYVNPLKTTVRVRSFKEKLVFSILENEIGSSWQCLIFEPVLDNKRPNLSVTRATHISFLLTIQIHHQEKRLGELIKGSPQGKCFDHVSNSLNLFFKKMFGDLSLENLYVWIMGLKIWPAFILIVLTQNCHNTE